MKLLFIHEVNWRKKVVFEMHDFPELLSLRGHEVVFLDFAEGEEPAGFRRILDLRTTVHSGLARAHSGAAVEVRTPGRVARPPFDRLLASLTQVPAIFKALKNEQFDAVVLYGVPTNGWQTVWLARWLGVPVLYRAIDVSHALRATVYGRLIEWAERVVYRRSTAISANNVALRDYIIAHGVDPDRVSIEYPGLDLERFQPRPRPKELAASLGIPEDASVILFMGTLYRFAGLAWFLEGIAPELRKRPDLRVLLIGGGEQEADLRSIASSLDIEDKVIFTGFIDYDRLGEYLDLGDVAINPFDRALVTDCALPGKVLQYLGSGLPTVCTPLAGLRGMLAEGDGVTYRDPGSEFVQGVLSLASDHALRAEMAARGRAAMERLCDWDRCTEAFEGTIEKTIERGRPNRGSKRRKTLSVRA